MDYQIWYEAREAGDYEDFLKEAAQVQAEQDASQPQPEPDDEAKSDKLQELIWEARQEQAEDAHLESAYELQNGDGDNWSDFSGAVDF